MGDSLDGPLDPVWHRVERLLALGERLLVSLRGNGERLLLDNLASDHPKPLFDRLDAAARTWLHSLPATCRVGDIFCCHGTPESDVTYPLEAVQPDGRVEPLTVSILSERLRPVPGRVVACGHSHLPRVVRLPDGGLVVNPGSVGLPAYTDDEPVPHAMQAGSPHARYAVLNRHAQDWEVELVALHYPWDEAADAARRNGRDDWAGWITTGEAKVDPGRGIIWFGTGPICPIRPMGPMRRIGQSRTDEFRQRERDTQTVPLPSSNPDRQKIMTLLQDLRHGFRALMRQPLFTAVSVLVLGLGIGANTAVFNVVNTVLLRPLTYPQADRLMFLHERMPDGSPKSVSILNYLDWQAEQRSFTDLGLVHQSGFNVSIPGGVGEPERLTGATVTANYIPILGIPPALGRNFTPAEDTPGGPPAVIISDALWRRQFAASPDVLGRSVVVDGVAREIVGVLPWAMRSPRHADVYIPLGDLRKDASRSFHAGFSAAGRLRDGVTPAQARDDLNALALALEKRYPDTNTGWRIRVERMIDESVGEYRASLYLLFGAVACVLLIACANVANLQLARAAARTRELAVRAALGASRARLVRQLLTESALVGVLGGAAGLLLALWATDAIRAVGPEDIPRFEDLRMDWQSLWFAAAAALVSGGLVGAWPAWRVTRTAALAASLHESSVRGSSGGPGQGRARAALAVAQLALTVALLAGAGLALKSFWRAWNAPFGFRRDGMLMVAATLPEARYNDDQTRTFYAELLARVRSLPGVEAAATAYNMPFDVYTLRHRRAPHGHPAVAAGREAADKGRRS